MIQQEKINYLRLLINEFNYSKEEEEKILSSLNPDWLTQEQTSEEIRKQFYASYCLWRGLGNALFKYINYVENTI